MCYILCMIRCSVCAAPSIRRGGVWVVEIFTPPHLGGHSGAKTPYARVRGQHPQICFVFFFFFFFASIFGGFSTHGFRRWFSNSS
jgi:hypothetical protein